MMRSPGTFDSSLLDRTPPKADLRLPYGTSPLQFGDLWLPRFGQAPSGKLYPVLIFVHGGWWKAEYDLEYASFLCQAMKQLGVAWATTVAAGRARCRTWLQAWTIWRRLRKPIRWT
jgi:acetyl esterase/lipase